MGLLTLLLIGVIVFFIQSLRTGINSSRIRSIGLLALIIGILGQLIGLFSAFKVMETMEGGISPSMLAGGIKVSMITTIYGVIIFGISQLLYLVATWNSSEKQE